jgi:DNA-binding MarR family transcriptional regulator
MLLTLPAVASSLRVLMANEHGHDEDPVIPALLRGARGAYADAIRERLAAAGYDDLPRNGAYVLGGAANHGAPIADLVRELRVSKQAASQLIDTLVLRGYLERLADAGDRRRIVIELTERGRGAAAAVEEGVHEVDRRLEELISADGMRGLRNGLLALWHIAETRRAASGEAAAG